MLKGQDLKILGLKPGASQQEIKRAFRRKALKYHPDRNPSRDAKEEFIRVKKAYERLKANRYYPSKKIPEKKKKQTNHSPQKHKKHTFEKRQTATRKQYVTRSTPYKRSDREIINNDYKKLQKSQLLKIFYIATSFAFLLSVVLVFDRFILPKKIEIGKVIQVRGYAYPSVSIYIKTVEGMRKIEVGKEFYFKHFIKKNELIEIYSTPLSDKTVYIKTLRRKDAEQLENSGLFFGVTLFFLAFLPLLSLLIKGPNIYYLLSVRVGLFFVFVGAFLWWIIFMG